MRLTMAEVCKFGNCTVSSPNFVEGEKLLNNNHILKCNKVPSTAGYAILAYCLETSDIKRILQLKGEINNDGSVKTFECPCKAESSSKCRHIIAALLYCNRNDIDKLDASSNINVRSDKKQYNEKVIEGCKATKLQDHECFKSTYKGCDSIKLSKFQITQIHHILFPKSDAAKITQETDSCNSLEKTLKQPATQITQANSCRPPEKSSKSKDHSYSK